MKKSICLFFTVILFVLSGCGKEERSDQSVYGLVNRLIPEYANNFIFEKTPFEKGKDVFEIETRKGKIVIRGNNGVSMARGLNHYLKEYCHCSSWWCGENLNLHEELPLMKKKIRVSSFFKNRYINNPTVNAYSTQFWHWSKWEKEIDWMAIQGINMALINTNTQWATMKELGLNRDNSESVKFNEEKIALQKKIINRMKEYGIKPVIRGFTGFVPASVKKKYPKVTFCNGGEWCGQPKKPFIHPKDPFFMEFGNTFYKVQKELYGDQNFIMADPVVEGTGPEGASLEEIGYMIQKLILDNYPDAQWVLQGWQGNPKDKVLTKTNRGKTVILDLWCEAKPQWRDRDVYNITPWVWNIINNFGGNTGMFGNIDLIFEQVKEAKVSSQGYTMCGVGTMMEAIENNPAIYSAVYDIAWDDVPATADEWLEKYVTSRYGADIPNTQQAWKILKRTVYNCETKQQGPSENIMCARPGLDIKSVSTWGTSALYYNPEELLEAWQLLLSESDKLGNIDSYQYDCVDLTRQVISNYALALYPKIKDAYQRKDKKQLKIVSNQFLELFDDLNSLLATRKEFLLGNWLKQSKSWGNSDADKLRMEEKAKTIITIWGSESYSELGELHDYSFREWEGITIGLYKKRWEKYLSILNQKLAGKVVEDPYWYDFDYTWIKKSEQYIDHPQGNAVTESRRLFEKYYKIINEIYSNEG